jgi:Raf kinase inhibitor-like YbhB/YbcL family protein
MKLTSPKFQENGIIPSHYTCEGANVNPPLEISGVPARAKALVLIMDDPDVPKTIRADGMWDHWIVFNIPPSTTHIAEGINPQGVAGKTTFGHHKYGGPCPSQGEHRYFFKLYALDQKLILQEGATKKEVEHAMQGHILQQTQLMGLYEKGKGY